MAAPPVRLPPNGHYGSPSYHVDARPPPVGSNVYATFSPASTPMRGGPITIPTTPTPMVNDPPQPAPQAVLQPRIAGSMKPTRSIVAHSLKRPNTAPMATQKVWLPQIRREWRRNSMRNPEVSQCGQCLQQSVAARSVRDACWLACFAWS